MKFNCSAYVIACYDPEQDKEFDVLGCWFSSKFDAERYCAEAKESDDVESFGASERVFYVKKTVETINGEKLGTGFSSKGEVVIWYKADDGFIALNFNNHYVESSNIDPRNDFDFIADGELEPIQ